jgi:hypothetical protein
MVRTLPEETPSVPEAASNVVDVLQDLIDDRVELTVARAQRAATDTARQAVLAVAAATFGLFTWVGLSITLGLGLATVWPAWAASLVVTSIQLSVTGTVALLLARRSTTLEVIDATE